VQHHHQWQLLAESDTGRAKEAIASRPVQSHGHTGEPIPLAHGSTSPGKHRLERLDRNPRSRAECWRSSATSCRARAWPTAIQRRV
jgi:hypothetical protein